MFSLLFSFFLSLIGALISCDKLFLLGDTLVLLSTFLSSFPKPLLLSLSFSSCFFSMMFSTSSFFFVNCITLPSSTSFSLGISLFFSFLIDIFALSKWFLFKGLLLLLLLIMLLWSSSKIPLIKMILLEFLLLSSLLL